MSATPPRLILTLQKADLSLVPVASWQLDSDEQADVSPGVPSADRAVEIMIDYRALAGVVIPMSGVAFEPARTLFVAKAWPLGSDLLVFFTSVNAAMLQAAALVPPPSAGDPVLIQIFPGPYPDGAITWRSGVHACSGIPSVPIEIAAPIVWNPGQGINAPDAASFEQISLFGLRINAFASDCTAKGGGANSLCDVQATEIAGPLSCVGRPGGQDTFKALAPSGGTGGGSWTFNNTIAELIGLALRDSLTLQGNADLDARACSFAQNVNLQGTSTARFPGSRLAGGAALTVAAGAFADFRAGNYDTQAQLVGPGPVDRTVHRIMLAFPPLGASSYAIDPPFPSADYAVSAEQLGFQPAAELTFTHAAGALQVDAAIGGFSYNFTLIRN